MNALPIATNVWTIQIILSIFIPHVSEDARQDLNGITKILNAKDKPIIKIMFTFNYVKRIRNAKRATHSLNVENAHSILLKLVGSALNPPIHQHPLT